MRLAWIVLLGFLGLPLLGQEAVPLNYASFVCWNYPNLPHLVAWEKTEEIVALALAEGYPTLHQLDREKNGSPGQLTSFLQKLPDAPGGITLVYLAAHQSPGGQWYFPDGSVLSWSSLGHDLPALKQRPQLVFLDCCYAASATLYPGWLDKVAPACVFASAANEPTPDLFVFRRRPVDTEFLFPLSARWLRQHYLGGSDLRVSFFGLCWLETWLNRPTPPRNWEEWRDFSQAMTETSQRVATQVPARYVSSIVSQFPP